MRSLALFQVFTREDFRSLSGFIVSGTCSTTLEGKQKETNIADYLCIVTLEFCILFY